jgi:ATP-binding cassette subfamily B protein
MTLAAMLVMPVSLVVIGQVIKRSQKYFKQKQEYLGELNGQVEEMFGGHGVVAAFNGQEDAIKNFGEVNLRLRNSTRNAQFVSGLMPPVMNLVGNLGYVMVCMLGGWLAVRGAVSIGGIQAFIQYMRQLTHPLGMMAQISNTLQSTAAAAERLFEFLDETEEEPEAENASPGAMCKTVRGEVTFENVTFGYRPEQTVIHGFSAEIRPGQKVAVVGPTGAGTTTIVKLLMRFYELNGGNILIDGKNIKDMPKSELRACFGMVLQDAWLYNATIMENLRYGSFGASDEEVMAAAKAACCDDFIRSLPGGYNMVLSEDAENISQGQRQLFTIARVALRDPKILILDEATSSVDTRTELLIQDAMDRLKNGRTSFVIAHRLSTIKNADTILVLNEGDIVEQGKHEELLAKGGFYAGLYNSQFG